MIMEYNASTFLCKMINDQLYDLTLSLSLSMRHNWFALGCLRFSLRGLTVTVVWGEGERGDFSDIGWSPR